MAGPIARLVANLVVMGAGIVSKAFVQAYQQAVVNAKSGKTAAQAAQAVVRKNKMQVSQALEILNFSSGRIPPMEDVNAQFQKYFEANDPSKGGSFYLQSKIFRAKEAIEKELEEEQKKSQEQEKTN